jgi:hypothetical protein
LSSANAAISSVWIARTARAAGIRAEAFNGVSQILCRIKARSLEFAAKNMSLISAASFGRIARLDAIRNCASVGCTFSGGAPAGAVAIAVATGRECPGCGRRSPSLSMISAGVAG